MTGQIARPGVHTECMRELPAGIRLERAGPADSGRVVELVQAGIDGYRQWAPGWTPPQPTAEQRERLDANFARDDAWILIALADGGELAGVVSMAASTAAQKEAPPPGTVYLWQMFVRPDWQGTGLAQALMDLAFEEARTRGFDRMVLWAAAGATQARRFYEREGWTPGEPFDDPGFGMALVEFRREL
jgi:GNAT superfamily N-acetyltransferase